MKKLSVSDSGKLRADKKSLTKMWPVLYAALISILMLTILSFNSKNINPNQVKPVSVSKTAIQPPQTPVTESKTEDTTSTSTTTPTQQTPSKSKSTPTPTKPKSTSTTPTSINLSISKTVNRPSGLSSDTYYYVTAYWTVNNGSSSSPYGYKICYGILNSEPNETLNCTDENDYYKSDGVVTQTTSIFHVTILQSGTFAARVCALQADGQTCGVSAYQTTILSAN